MGPAPMRCPRPPRRADEALDEFLGPAERTAMVAAPPFTALGSPHGRGELIVEGPSHHGRIAEHVPARLRVREEPVHPSRGAS